MISPATPEQSHSETRLGQKRTIHVRMVQGDSFVIVVNAPLISLYKDPPQPSRIVDRLGCVSQLSTWLTALHFPNPSCNREDCAICPLPASSLPSSKSIPTHFFITSFCDLVYFDKATFSLKTFSDRRPVTQKRVDDRIGLTAIRSDYLFHHDAQRNISSDQFYNTHKHPNI